MSTLQLAADTITYFAQSGQVVPEAPPGSEKFMKLVRWMMWFVMLAGVSALVYAGGKFAWEKYNGGSLESPRIVVGALVGGIVATSASSIMNGIVLS